MPHLSTTRLKQGLKRFLLDSHNVKCGRAIVRGIADKRGHKPSHPRTRIATEPHTPMLHRTILATLFKQYPYWHCGYVAPHHITLLALWLCCTAPYNLTGIVVMLHRNMANRICCTAPYNHDGIVVMLHRTILAFKRISHYEI